jgi:exonuclease III
LLRDGSDLIDVVSLNKFVKDEVYATHWSENHASKLDYILLSPALLAKVSDAGIEKRGVWAGKAGDKFPHLPEITKSVEAASDHAALWVDLDI